MFSIAGKLFCPERCRLTKRMKYFPMYLDIKLNTFKKDRKDLYSHLKRSKVFVFKYIVMYLTRCLQKVALLGMERPLPAYSLTRSMSSPSMLRTADPKTAAQREVPLSN